MDEIEWIRAGLEKPGKSRSGLAKALGRAPSAVTALLKGARELKAREIAVVAEYLEVEAPENAGAARALESPSRNADLPPSNIEVPADQSAFRFSGFGGPRNVPVYGTAYGGSDGDFRFNGQTEDYIPRPPSLAGRDKVYGIYVRGQSMEPKYEEGESIYIDPVRPPQIGDYVIVELHSPEEGEAGAGFLKRLVKRTPNRIVVSQFNPAKEIEFERDQVKALHRVIPWPELLGV